MITFILLLIVYWLWLRPRPRPHVEPSKVVPQSAVEEIRQEQRKSNTGGTNNTTGPHPKPVIVFFRSNVDGDVLIEGEVLEFSWQVLNADHVRLITEYESFDVTSTSHCHLRFFKGQQVKLVADNKFGRKDTRELRVNVVPRPRFDSVFPTPVIVHQQFAQFSIPPIPSMRPPSLSILEQALAFGGLLNIAGEIETTLEGQEIKETQSIN
jgi:hypothetical protein